MCLLKSHINSKLNFQQTVNMCDRKIYVEIENAKNCSIDKKEQIKLLIKREGHVDITHFDRLWSRNPIIATIYSGEKLAACGALKKPKESHIKSVFSEAKSELNSKDFQYELGWIVTEPCFRGKGYCREIVKKLLERNGNTPVFATVRDYNAIMCAILNKNRFAQEGFRRQGNGDYSIILFIRK